MTDWSDVVAAVTTTLGGDREAGRRDMARCWDDLEAADHAKRCVLAHYLADVQDDLADEVAWDEKALASYASVADADLAPVGIASAVGLGASLHLNLGDGYLRQGRIPDARRELDAGMAAAAVLGDDGYGAMIRSGLAGLEARLEAGES